jgi:hypothetical protein
MEAQARQQVDDAAALVRENGAIQQYIEEQARRKEAEEQARKEIEEQQTTERAARK